MRIVTDPVQIQGLLDQWKQVTAAAGAKGSQCTIGWPSGSRTITMYWLPAYCYWVAFDRDGDHYWNPCGLESPYDSKDPKTVCDISIPCSGLDRRVRSAFAVDGGRHFIIHRGGLGRGGGARGMTREEFFRHFAGDTAYIEGNDKVAVVAELGSGQFLNDVADFLQGYSRLRNLRKDGWDQGTT